MGRHSHGALDPSRYLWYHQYYIISTCANILVLVPFSCLKPLLFGTPKLCVQSWSMEYALSSVVQGGSGATSKFSGLAHGPGTKSTYIEWATTRGLARHDSLTNDWPSSLLNQFHFSLEKCLKAITNKYSLGCMHWCCFEFLFLGMEYSLNP
jgi:hypothetical protein